MTTIDLETYDSWRLELPVVPLRSRLYHLQPIGVGTPYVESLTGYICRLAQSHCVSPRTLICQEIHPISNPNSKSQYYVPELLGSEFGINVNSGEMSAQHYIRGLETLTLRVNLQSLTMQAWKWKKLAPAEAPIRYLRAWCPKCYQKWQNTGATVYEPLLWSIAPVVVCPSHRKPLQSLCPHCGQRQGLITGKMRPGYCSKCQQWLGSIVN